MSLYTITVINNAPGCNAEIDQQLTVSGCSTYIVRLASNSNAIGPFDVYVNSVIVYSAVTRTEMLQGVLIVLECATPTTTPTPTPTPTINFTTPTQTPSNSPTPSETPTNTPTNTQTPTNTSTPGLTPSQTPTNSETPTQTPTNTPTPTIAAFKGYVFPEPQDSTSQFDLGTFTYNLGGNFNGFSNNGGPAGGATYAADMAIYAQYSGWTGSSGNFITDVATLSNSIRQSVGTGTDSQGCPQNQYTFGSVGITTLNVNPSIQYVYTVWIPLAGVGGTLNNMTLDVGIGAPCSTSIIDNAIPDTGNAGTNVIVPSGCAIPAGTYRVLWINELYYVPNTLPLGSTLWIKGDAKTP